MSTYEDSQFKPVENDIIEASSTMLLSDGSK